MQISKRLQATEVGYDNLIKLSLKSPVLITAYRERFKKNNRATLKHLKNVVFPETFPEFKTLQLLYITTL